SGQDDHAKPLHGPPRAVVGSERRGYSPAGPRARHLEIGSFRAESRGASAIPARHKLELPETARVEVALVPHDLAPAQSDAAVTTEPGPVHPQAQGKRETALVVGPGRIAPRPVVRSEGDDDRLGPGDMLDQPAPLWTGLEPNDASHVDGGAQRDHDRLPLP